jgi:hypothetical protein
VQRDRPLECPQSTTGIALHASTDLIEVEQAPVRRLVHDPRELVRRLRVGEVDEQPRDRRARNAPHLRDVPRVKPPRPVHVEPVRAALGLGDHRDQANRPTADAAELGRGHVARRRAFAAGEHRRHAPALEAEPRVPDRMHATVHAVQPATPDPPTHGVLAQPRLEELLERDHAVLACGQRGDDRVRIRGCDE